MKVLVWLLALVLSPTGLTEVKIWAVGDGVRVNPVTGKLLEDRLDIHKDYPTGDYRSSNSIWKAASKTVSLKAARNEFVAFQLIIDAPQPVDEVDVAALELAHSSGTRLAGRNVQLFKEWYVEVRRPSTGYEGTSLGPAWYPDALLPKRPARLNTGFPFSIPDVYNNIPGQKNHAVWVDVYVPHDRTDAPPGLYSGKLQIRWKGGQDTINISTSGILRCLTKATSRVTFGTVRCGRWSQPKSCSITSWPGSIGSTH